MNIFLSYSSEDQKIAESICLRLREDKHSVFFSKTDLPPTADFNKKIRTEIQRAKLFIFLISPDSIKKGSFTLTELKIVQDLWVHPKSRVLPVVLRQVPITHLPPFLSAVNLLDSDGNIVADVAYEVAKIKKRRQKKLIIRAISSIAVIPLILGIGLSSGALPMQSLDWISNLIGKAKNCLRWERIDKGIGWEKGFAGGNEPKWKLYVCRVKMGGQVFPGKMISGYGCYVGIGEVERVFKDDFEVLINDNCGLQWVSAPSGVVPVNSVVGGSEAEQALYICRAEHEGGIHIGRTGWATNHECIISYANKAFSEKIFEVLVR